MKRRLLHQNYCKLGMALLLSLAMFFSTIGVGNLVADAASKPAFQKSKLQLAKGKSVKLTVKKLPKGAKIVKTKWKVQKKSVLKVTLSGSKAKKKKAKTAKIKGLKAGKSKVYCTVTYRVKKGKKWKKISKKVKAVVTVTAKAKVTPTPKKSPSPVQSPGNSATGTPDVAGSPTPDVTTSPGVTDGPTADVTTSPGVTSGPTADVTTSPGVTSGPTADVTSSPGVTSSPVTSPTAVPTPAITPNPQAEVLTWTGSMVSTVWTESGNIEGSYSQTDCSDGLTVEAGWGNWYFNISSTKWSDYNYPMLKCYPAAGDTTTGDLEVWYGGDDTTKKTYSYTQWSQEGVALDKEKVAEGISICNRSPLSRIEIYEGEAQIVDVGSYDFSRTALEFSKDLKIGWNVGNTLDSVIGSGEYVSGDSGLAAETAWGCPKVTESLIKAVKAAGFNTIRVPVSWTNHTDASNNYQIDEKWMDRVEEVVQYCTKNGLHVILNVHHDGNDSDGSWLSPEPSDAAVMKARYQRVWEQIAKRFKDYSSLVIFSSMNEYHHGYNAPPTSYYTLQNELHQIFVDTVRQSGGYNGNRYLILPGYNTNIDQTIEGLKLPTDSCADHLMVEVHYYDPYTFAADGNETDQWGSDYSSATATDSWGQEEYLISQLKKMKTNFVDKGIPVVIGEFGAPAKTDSANEKYRTYYLQYVVKYATEYGLVPVYWDNGSSYKLFDRNSGATVYPDIVNGMMAALVDGYEIPIP